MRQDQHACDALPDNTFERLRDIAAGFGADDAAMYSLMA
jgi:hypothetical protein